MSDESELARLRQVVQALEVLRELSEKATPGPWGWRPFGGDPANLCRIVVYPPAVETWAVIAEDMEPENADFIVAAVEYVRAGLAAAAGAPQPGQRWERADDEPFPQTSTHTRPTPQADRRRAELEQFARLGQPADPPTVLTHEWRSTVDATECNRCGAEFGVGRWVNCPGPSPAQPADSPTEGPPLCYACGKPEPGHQPTSSHRSFIDSKNVCHHTIEEGCTGHGDF